MIRTLNLLTEVRSNREVRITLPGDIPLGLVEMVIVVAPQVSNGHSTLGDLLRSEFFGMWRDRTDISDSAEFARCLRDCALITCL